MKVRVSLLCRIYPIPSPSQLKRFPLCLKYPKEVASPKILGKPTEDHPLGTPLPVVGGHGEAIFLRVVRVGSQR